MKLCIVCTFAGHITRRWR